jgi:uncharacterized membrane protein
MIEKRQVMMTAIAQLVCYSLIFDGLIVQVNYLSWERFWNPNSPGLQAEGNWTCLYKGNIINTESAYPQK